MTDTIKIDKDTQLDLTIGTELNVGIEGISAQLSSSVIGLESDVFLLIRPPSPLSTSKYKLYPDNQIILRYLSQGHIIAFRTKIIEFLTKPFFLLFLEYPKELLYRNIRGIKRANCFIPCKTKIKSIERDGVITDISPKGCRCLINLLAHEKSIFIRKDDDVLLESEFMGASGDNVIKGTVKNNKKEGHKLVLGVQFNIITKEIEQTILQYSTTVEDFS